MPRKNLVGAKPHASEKCPSAIRSQSKPSSKEMLYDDLAKTLVLLELETDEPEHPIAQHNVLPAAPPSLASSQCSLSLHHEDDQDFCLSERTSKVAFSTVTVREYAITIGDHPCCSTGFPLCLDWQYDVLSEESLDHFEAHHGQRRNRIELITTYEERKLRLEECCDQDAKRLNRRLERHRSRCRDAAAFFTS